MDYRSRNISVEVESFKELIRKLNGGHFLIPTFQRQYVWDPDRICRLWHSIYECYPIGCILYWETPICLHVHRRLGGFYIPDAEHDNGGSPLYSYILDGQQRVTSLCVSLNGGVGKIRELYDFDFTLYFDLKTSEFFFEREYYRHRWNADSELLLRLKDVPDLPADYCSFLTDVPGSVKSNFERVRCIFTDYQVPMIRLEGFDIPSVCAIFERINRNGIRLENQDILIARSFENCDVVVEEDFPVK